MGARAAAGLALVALALAACAPPWEPFDEAGSFNAEQSTYTPQTVGRFDRHALYWLGERFEGWNLTLIDDSMGFVTFIYGDCAQTGGDEGGCTPPLQVQVFPPASSCAPTHATRAGSTGAGAAHPSGRSTARRSCSAAVRR